MLTKSLSIDAWAAGQARRMRVATGITHRWAPDTAARVCDYLTSERRRNSSPTTRGMTIQIIVVEASIAHS